MLGSYTSSIQGYYVAPPGPLTSFAMVKGLAPLAKVFRPCRRLMRRFRLHCEIKITLPRKLHRRLIRVAAHLEFQLCAGAGSQSSGQVRAFEREVFPINRHRRKLVLRITTGLDDDGAAFELVYVNQRHADG